MVMKCYTKHNFTSEWARNTIFLNLSKFFPNDPHNSWHALFQVTPSFMVIWTLLSDRCVTPDNKSHRVYFFFLLFRLLKKKPGLKSFDSGVSCDWTSDPYLYCRKLSYPCLHVWNWQVIFDKHHKYQEKISLCKFSYSVCLFREKLYSLAV